MKRMIRMFSLFAVFSLVLGVGAVQIASAQDKFDVDKAIAAGDHAGLAKYYKEQAEMYRQKAASHENMHADYKKSGVHYKGMENTFAAHCAILKENALKSAEKYDELAKQEEALAAPKTEKK